MNLQIFGTKKSQETKKAERFFKERNIAFQFIDLNEKAMSKRELLSVLESIKNLEDMLDPKCKDQDTYILVNYLAEEEKFNKILENQQILKLPIVRNKEKATVGFCPDNWKEWLKTMK